MKLKAKLKITVVAAVIALASPAIAQNNVSETAVVDPAEPAGPTTTDVALPPPAPTPAPTTSETVVTTTPAPVTVPPLEDPLDNPYANSYNELLPLETEEDRGFDDWGLLGLLGLFGLFGLRRRERLVYVEPAPTIVTRTQTHDRTPTPTVVRDTPPPGGPVL
ncbi:MAG: WGxxGxxG-CTERM domain-containing protein [Sphingosinicella sp.]|nr:WGxxGxxG-CTERM domain-containing protein [Sphingosinicella sp.]